MEGEVKLALWRISNRIEHEVHVGSVVIGRTKKRSVSHESDVIWAHAALFATTK